MDYRLGLRVVRILQYNVNLGPRAFTCCIPNGYGLPSSRIMSGLRSCLILDQLTHEKEEYRYPRQRARAEGAQRFALCKRSGFLAALVMTDGVRFAAAFGGRAFQVAVARPGSADEASLKRNSGGCGRRLLRPRWATIAPTSDAGEDQLISE